MIKKDAYISNEMQLQTFFYFSFTKISHFFQLLSCSSIAYNTTASMDNLTCTDLWTLANAKTDLDIFYGPELIPTTWILNSKFAKKMITKISDWYKILLWERQISTKSCDCPISWSLQQNTMLERKTCLHLWHQHCPKTWMNNSNCSQVW